MKKNAFNDFARKVGSMLQRQAGTALDDYVVHLDEDLVRSGEPEGMDGLTVLGFQGISAVLFPVIWGVIIRKTGMFDFIFSGPHVILVFIGLTALGFHFPRMSIRDRIKRRLESITLQLPDVIDLLTVCVEAGLDFLGAMRIVIAQERPGPLKEELERFLKQLELGRQRADALRDMSRRIGLPDLASVAAALIQAARLGSPLGPVLRMQSDVLRTRRGQRAEKSAMEATVKMLAPLMLCIFPAVFIMILAPVMIQMSQNWK
jgi:tight adherence protein C